MASMERQHRPNSRQHHRGRYRTELSDFIEYGSKCLQFIHFHRQGGRMRNIHLIIAILALSLFGIVTSESSLPSWFSVDVRRAIGFTTLATNFAIGIYGAIGSHRIAWCAYLALSVAGLLLVGASTPINALWLASKLL